MLRKPGQLALVALLVALASCTTRPPASFLPQNGPAPWGPKDGVAQSLTEGLDAHWRGRPLEAIEQLDRAERLIEENYTKSLTNVAASFLINDLELDYAGDAYEDLYTNVFKALDYLKLGRYDDAYVEVQRLDIKLNLLEDRSNRLAEAMNQAQDARGLVEAGKTEFHNSALARYLSFLLYRAEGRLDDAELDLKQIRAAFESQSSIYSFPPPQFENSPTVPGMARISVLTFTGRVPTKIARELRLKTERDRVSVTDNLNKVLLVIPLPGTQQGFTFRTQVPELRSNPTKVTQVQVRVDGQVVGDLVRLESIEAVARATFDLSRKPAFSKTLLRTLAKGFVAEKAKQAAAKAVKGSGSTASSVLGSAVGIGANLAVNASERADLRGAYNLPGWASVGEFLVPAGKHSVTIDYLDAQGRSLATDDFDEWEYSSGLNLVTTSFLE